MHPHLLLFLPLPSAHFQYQGFQSRSVSRDGHAVVWPGGKVVMRDIDLIRSHLGQSRAEFRLRCCCDVSKVFALPSAAVSLGSSSRYRGEMYV